MIKLDRTEIEYLLKLLSPGREYYRTLAGNPKCTQANRTNHLFIEKLYSQLHNVLCGDASALSQSL